MYFNPSWSHAHSAFMVALLFWYWLKTREQRTLLQWMVLGAVAGLMLNVYYANAMLLGLVGMEAAISLASLAKDSRQGASETVGATFPKLLASYAVFAGTLLVCLLPVFVTKHLIYGSSTESGYIPISLWNWTSPFFFQILFSTNHGLFSWTPILVLSAIGLFLFCRKNPRVGGPVLFSSLAFYYFMSSYPDWAGISSFGNRFFVSLTVFFVLGLAVFVESCARVFRSTRAAISACVNSPPSRFLRITSMARIGVLSLAAVI